MTDDIKTVKRSWILFAVCIVAFMVQIDFTAVNVALEAMSKTAHTDLTTIQWVLSAYVLAWGAMVIPAGRLADLYGKRRTFILGTFIFILGSALTGLSTTAWMMVTSRVIQGIGGAIFLPSIYTLVFTAYPNEERGKAMGILTTAFAFGMAIGPTLGGVMLHLLDWRYIFFVNIPLGLIVIAIALNVIPKEPKKLLNESMDYFGSIIFAGTFIVFMLGVDKVKDFGLLNPITLLLFSGAIALFLLTIFWQRRAEFPILRLSLFTNKAFIGCILSYLLLGYNFAAILIIGGLFLQNVMNYSAFYTGLIFLCLTIGFGVLSAFSGRLCDKFDCRIPIALGGLASAMGTLIFMFLTDQSPLWMVCIMFFVAGIGFGFAFPGLNLAMMRTVNDNELNSASGTFTLFGCLGNTVGLIMSAVSIVYFGQAKLLALFSNAGLALTNAQAMQLKQLMASAHQSLSSLDLLGSNHLQLVVENLKQASTYAMSRSLSIALFFALVSIIIGVIMIKVPKVQKHQENVN